MRRRPPWFLPVASGVLALSLAVTATWGYITNRDLEQTQADLAAAREIVVDQDEQLRALGRNLEREEARADELVADVIALEARVRNQDACIAALDVDASILTDVGTKQREIHNLTAEGSDWAEAIIKREAATDDALDSYFQAYSAAWDGLYAAANDWVERGNAQVRESNVQLSVMNTEIDKVNALLDEVEALLDEYTRNDISICMPSLGSSS